MKPLAIDRTYLRDNLLQLLEIPSPTGLTDAVVQYLCEQLRVLDIEFELTRRGAIRASLPGRIPSPSRAIVAHLDTLGAMVRRLKPNGRLAVAQVGTWPARSAEGARVTLITDSDRRLRGSLLPLQASGHVYGKRVDSQEASWENLELRLDERVRGVTDLVDLGINVGDMVAVDPAPEFLDNGFLVSRFLDDKAGVAAVLAAAQAIRREQVELPVACQLLFTLSEETGAGASHILREDVAELVAIDNGTIAPEQNTAEYGATICMQDSSGPFDRQLTRRLTSLCDRHDIDYSRDVFRYYRCDAAAAVEAGNDLRTALLCFAVDASHGYERSHEDSLVEVARLLTSYLQSGPLFEADNQLPG